MKRIAMLVLAMNITVGFASTGCIGGEEVAYPIPIFVDDHSQLVTSGLFIGFYEVRYDRNIDTFNKNELEGNVGSFVRHINSIRNREFADEFKYTLPGTWYDTVDKFKAYHERVLDSNDHLSDVYLIAKVCMGDTDVFFWHAFVHNAPKDKYEQVNSFVFATAFEKGADARFSEDNANYLLSLLQLVYINNQKLKLDGKEKPIQDFQYRYELGQDLSANESIQGTGISLIFNGSTLGARLSSEEELNLSKNELVRFYATAFNALRSGDFDKYTEKHTEASKQRWHGQFSSLTPEYHNRWRNSLEERYVIFLMDADPLKILFYVDGYTDEFEEFLRGERDSSSLESSKYSINHEYFVEKKDGYLITHAKFTSFLDQVFKNNNLFVERVLIPILFENR